MKTSELIAKLQDILSEHGDVIVMHHDDWTDFVVEAVTFDDGGSVDLSPSGRVRRVRLPHVLITGERQWSDCNGGLTEREEIKIPAPLSKVSFLWLQLGDEYQALGQARREAIAEGIDPASDSMRDRMRAAGAAVSAWIDSERHRISGF